jgi:hypothetical protein
MSSLNLLLSSSNFPIFSLRQFFLFDLFEKVLIFDFKHFYTCFVKPDLSFINVKFEIVLPFANDLSKFRNKVLVLLYYFVFELLVGFSPLVLPVITKKIDSLGAERKNLIRKKKFDSLLNNYQISKFVFYRDLRLSQSSIFLTFVSFFISKHAYLNYTVPSKLLKVSVSSRSFRFSLNPGLSSLDLFSQFDDFVLSRVLLSFSFARKKFLLSNQFKYFLSSLGLNLFNVNSIVVNNGAFLNDSNEKNQGCFYCENKLFLVPSSI